MTQIDDPVLARADDDNRHQGDRNVPPEAQAPILIIVEEPQGNVVESLAKVSETGGLEAVICCMQSYPTFGRIE